MYLIHKTMIMNDDVQELSNDVFEQLYEMSSKNLESSVKVSELIAPPIKNILKSILTDNEQASILLSDEDFENISQKHVHLLNKIKSFVLKLDDDLLKSEQIYLKTLTEQILGDM